MLGKTDIQVGIFQSPIIKAYVKQRELAIEEVFEFSANQKLLIEHQEFLVWLWGMRSTDRRKKIKEIITLGEAINLNNLGSNEVREYLRIGLISMRQVLELRQAHRNLLELPNFMQCLSNIGDWKLGKRELQKIMDISFNKININNFDRAEVQDLITNRTYAYKLSLHVAVQLEDEHVAALRNRQIQECLVDGILNSDDFLRLKNEQVILEYIASQRAISAPVHARR